MDRPISPPRVARRGTGTTRYEKEVASSPKVADDPGERKWVGPWLMGDTIGKGASGRVRLARHKRTRKLAAIKIIPKVHIGGPRADPKAERVMQSIRREMVVMKLIHHPHIMDMYDVYEDKNDLYLLLEYVEGGELFDYLVSKGRLDITEAVSYFRQIISGLDYCHRFNICHRDLKPENLLLDKDKNIKIADFGMAALEIDGREFLETSCGSPHYASPEIVSGRRYHGAASDIWSCGVVLFALLTGRLPFDHVNMGELLRRVKAGKFEMPRSIPKEARDLLSHMLVVNPEQRYTMKMILSHPFLQLSDSNIPRVIEPSFADAATAVPSEDLIDRQILDNLITLFRKMDQGEIVKSLLNGDRNWQKAFYFLLKNYHERQSEEYGHGMSFVDFSGAEEPSVTNMRKRLSQGSTNVGPHGTIKARSVGQATTALAPSHRTSPPGNYTSSRLQNGNEREQLPLPIATRAAPSPKDPATRRQRAPVPGPRAPGSPEHTSHSPKILPSHVKREAHESTISTVVSPVDRPARSQARPRVLDSNAVLMAPPTPVLHRGNNTEARKDLLPLATNGFNRRLEGQHSPSGVVPSERPRANTLGSEKAKDNHQLPTPPIVPVELAKLALNDTGIPVQSPTSPSPNSMEQRILEQRLRNANIMGVPITTGVEQNTSNSTHEQKGTEVSPLIGLGLSLPTPPPLITPPSPTISLPPLLSVSAEHSSAPVSPYSEPPSHLYNDPKMIFNEHSDRLAREATEPSAIPKLTPRPRNPSLHLDTSKLIERTAAAYPSPPPSQASSLEPFLVMQQSPVFSERFSLHLDAMLPDLRAATKHDQCEADIDEESVSEEEAAGIAEVEVELAIKTITPIEEVAPTARLIEKRPRANTATSLAPLGPDWSFLGEAEEARQAVPAQPSPMHGSKRPRGKTTMNSVLPRPSPNAVFATSPAPRRYNSTGSVAPLPVTENTGTNAVAPVRPRKAKPEPLDFKSPVSRMSTFVAAPPSPLPTPTLEPVQTGWFSQLFHVKPAAYVFHSQDNFATTRNECATLMRSFGVSVNEVDNEGKYGILKCHVDYIQEVSGKMVINKPISFRAQITPHFTLRTTIISRNSEPAKATSPAETCTLSLVQEHGAKSTLEIIAQRLRQEWSLDSMIEPQTPRAPATPKLPFFS